MAVGLDDAPHANSMQNRDRLVKTVHCLDPDRLVSSRSEACRPWRPIDDMSARITTLVVLLSCLAASGCEDGEKLTPGERLLSALAANGFRISAAQTNAAPVNRLLDYETSECYSAYHHPSTLSLCFHHFKTPAKALEAKAQITSRRLPTGRYWISAVRGRSLVLVDARIQDRPVANKLISVFNPS